jgi:hypothetical protein
MAVANSLAYYEMKTIKAVKSFIVQALILSMTLNRITLNRMAIRKLTLSKAGDSTYKIQPNGNHQNNTYENDTGRMTL